MLAKILARRHGFKCTVVFQMNPMESEDLRRLYVNSVYWALGLESGIPQKADVNYVGGEWKASPFGGGKFRGGLKPADFAEK